uniref:Uncharacterized protein LOC114341591 n=1 Tax=Diabrotica virgifera virgifera TaxID=50390 RepID=A0A6P7GSE1_DIAVI
MILPNFLVILLILYYTQPTRSYIYPITQDSINENQESFLPKSIVTEDTDFFMDLLLSIIVPINNGICNVWINFLEVYDCIIHKYSSEDKKEIKEKTFFQDVFSWFGFGKEEEVQSKCSYYSITIVTGTVTIIAALLYSMKKMLEYFREEDYLKEEFENSFNRRFKICNCKLNRMINEY